MKMLGHTLKKPEPDLRCVIANAEGSNVKQTLQKPKVSASDALISWFRSMREVR